tara:strand:- start:473 stop:829 length:357 start_codon:yes stop_codon:yes gene_type:complete
MFDFFKKSKKLELEDQSVINVRFSVDPFGEVDIDIDWISDEDSVAMLLATLLHNINNGSYSTPTVDILSKTMKEDERLKTFISKALINWQNISAAETSKELPVVRPSDFSYGINKNEQ